LEAEVAAGYGAPPGGEAARLRPPTALR
jgi:hypothetical protein